jgi:hypothetical protein
VQQKKKDSREKGTVMKLANLVLPFPKLGSCETGETTTPGPRARGRPATTTTTTTEDGTRGRARVCGKEPKKKTHPEKAQKQIQKKIKIITIKAMIEGQLEG